MALLFSKLYFLMLHSYMPHFLFFEHFGLWVLFRALPLLHMPNVLPAACFLINHLLNVFVILFT